MPKKFPVKLGEIVKDIEFDGNFYTFDKLINLFFNIESTTKNIITATNKQLTILHKISTTLHLDNQDIKVVENDYLGYQAFIFEQIAYRYEIIGNLDLAQEYYEKVIKANQELENRNLPLDVEAYVQAYVGLANLSLQRSSSRDTSICMAETYLDKCNDVLDNKVVRHSLDENVFKSFKGLRNLLTGRIQLCKAKETLDIEEKENLLNSALKNVQYYFTSKATTYSIFGTYEVYRNLSYLSEAYHELSKFPNKNDETPPWTQLLKKRDYLILQNNIGHVIRTALLPPNMNPNLRKEQFTKISKDNPNSSLVNSLVSNFSFFWEEIKRIEQEIINSYKINEAEFTQFYGLNLPKTSAEEARKLGIEKYLPNHYESLGKFTRTVSENKNAGEEKEVG
jgi:hypothetical protein